MDLTLYVWRQKSRSDRGELVLLGMLHGRVRYELPAAPQSLSIRC